MCCGLDRTPVIASSDSQRVDAIHDALVVRRCPVWIYKSDIAGKNDAVTNRRPVQSVAGESGLRITHVRLHYRSVGQVGKNLQRRSAAADVGNQRCNNLTDCVDEIGTHRITGIDEHVHGEKRCVVRQCQRSKFQLSYAATPGVQSWVNLVRRIDKRAR